jgi:hypothetical protein
MKLVITDYDNLMPILDKVNINISLPILILMVMRKVADILYKNSLLKKVRKPRGLMPGVLTGTWQ